MDSSSLAIDTLLTIGSHRQYFHLEKGDEMRAGGMETYAKALWAVR
jgi:hypothetical protein